MNPWLDLLIQEARNGDDMAARALAGFLAVCLEKGEIPPALVKYFAWAFKNIAKGHSADDELNLGPKNAKFERDCEIAREVWKLNHRAVDPLPLRLNSSGDGAREVVGKKYGLSPDRVEQIYEKMRLLVEAEMMEETLEPGDPRPKGPEGMEKVDHRLKIDMQIAFAHLAYADALKKRDAHEK